MVIKWTVMKNRKAYENTLSIILDEPDIKMEEVKVEQVILNRYGKRAIRLDAWGKTVDNRQINMEMENNMHDDSYWIGNYILRMVQQKFS